MSELRNHQLSRQKMVTDIKDMPRTNPETDIKSMSFEELFKHIHDKVLIAIFNKFLRFLESSSFEVSFPFISTRCEEILRRVVLDINVLKSKCLNGSYRNVCDKIITVVNNQSKFYLSSVRTRMSMNPGVTKCIMVLWITKVFVARKTTEYTRQPPIMKKSENTTLPMQNTNLPINVKESPLSTVMKRLENTTLSVIDKNKLQNTNLPINVKESPLSTVMKKSENTTLSVIDKNKSQNTNLPINVKESPLSTVMTESENTSLSVIDKNKSQNSNLPINVKESPLSTVMTESKNTTLSVVDKNKSQNSNLPINVKESPLSTVMTESENTTLSVIDKNKSQNTSFPINVKESPLSTVMTESENTTLSVIDKNKSQNSNLPINVKESPLSTVMKKSENTTLSVIDKNKSQIPNLPINVKESPLSTVMTESENTTLSVIDKNKSQIPNLPINVKESPLSTVMTESENTTLSVIDKNKLQNTNLPINVKESLNASLSTIEKEIKNSKSHHNEKLLQIIPECNEENPTNPIKLSDKYAKVDSGFDKRCDAETMETADFQPNNEKVNSVNSDKGMITNDCDVEMFSVTNKPKTVDHDVKSIDYKNMIVSEEVYVPSNQRSRSFEDLIKDMDDKRLSENFNKFLGFLVNESLEVGFPFISNIGEEIFRRIVLDVNVLKSKCLDATHRDVCDRIITETVNNQSVFHLSYAKKIISMKSEVTKISITILVIKKVYVETKTIDTTVSIIDNEESQNTNLSVNEKESLNITVNDENQPIISISCPRTNSLESLFSQTSSSGSVNKSESSSSIDPVTTDFKSNCLRTTLEFVKHKSDNNIIRYEDLTFDQAKYVYEMVSSVLNYDEYNINLGNKLLYTALWETVKSHSYSYEFKLGIEEFNLDKSVLVLEKTLKVNPNTNSDEEKKQLLPKFSELAFTEQIRKKTKAQLKRQALATDFFKRLDPGFVKSHLTKLVNLLSKNKVAQLVCKPKDEDQLSFCRKVIEWRNPNVRPVVDRETDALFSKIADLMVVMKCKVPKGKKNIRDPSTGIKEVTYKASPRNPVGAQILGKRKKGVQENLPFLSKMRKIHKTDTAEELKKFLKTQDGTNTSYPNFVSSTQNNSNNDKDRGSSADRGSTATQKDYGRSTEDVKHSSSSALPYRDSSLDKPRVRSPVDVHRKVTEQEKLIEALSIPVKSDKAVKRSAEVNHSWSTLSYREVSLDRSRDRGHMNEAQRKAKLIEVLKSWKAVPVKSDKAMSVKTKNTSCRYNLRSATQNKPNIDKDRGSSADRGSTATQKDYGRPLEDITHTTKSALPYRASSLDRPSVSHVNFHRKGTEQKDLSIPVKSDTVIKRSAEDVTHTSWSTATLSYREVSLDKSRVRGHWNETHRKKTLIEALSVPVKSDKALRMMRGMGWSGGGLGARGNGITEPLMPKLDVVKGAGFGHIPRIRLRTITTSAYNTTKSYPTNRKTTNQKTTNQNPINQKTTNQNTTNQCPTNQNTTNQCPTNQNGKNQRDWYHIHIPRYPNGITNFSLSKISEWVIDPDIVVVETDNIVRKTKALLISNLSLDTMIKEWNPKRKKDLEKRKGEKLKDTTDFRNDVLSSMLDLLSTSETSHKIKYRGATTSIDRIFFNDAITTLGVRNRMSVLDTEQGLVDKILEKYEKFPGIVVTGSLSSNNREVVLTKVEIFSENEMKEVTGIPTGQNATKWINQFLKEDIISFVDSLGPKSHGRKACNILRFKVLILMKIIFFLHSDFLEYQLIFNTLLNPDNRLYIEKIVEAVNIKLKHGNTMPENTLPGEKSNYFIDYLLVLVLEDSSLVLQKQSQNQLSTESTLPSPQDNSHTEVIDLDNYISDPERSPKKKRMKRDNNKSNKKTDDETDVTEEMEVDYEFIVNCEETNLEQINKTEMSNKKPVIDSEMVVENSAIDITKENVADKEMTDVLATVVDQPPSSIAENNDSDIAKVQFDTDMAEEKNNTFNNSEDKTNTNGVCKNKTDVVSMIKIELINEKNKLIIDKHPEIDNKDVGANKTDMNMETANGDNCDKVINVDISESKCDNDLIVSDAKTVSDAEIMIDNSNGDGQNSVQNKLLQSIHGENKNVFIVPNGFPNEKITKQRAIEIQRMISDNIIKTKELPLLMCHGVQKGALIYSCHSNKTYDWLKTTISEANDIRIIDTEGVQRMSLKFYCLFRFDDNYLFQMIEMFNPGLSTKEWVVEETEIHDDFTIYLIKMDDSSINFIHAADLSLYVGIDKVEFSFIWD